MDGRRAIALLYWQPPDTFRISDFKVTDSAFQVMGDLIVLGYHGTQLGDLPHHVCLMGLEGLLELGYLFICLLARGVLRVGTPNLQGLCEIPEP